MNDLKIWASDSNRNLAPVAVIDIGSNSIRLVIYEGMVRAPVPIFNEKILCGLGRGLNATGRLDEEGVERALRALPRFAEIARNMKVGEIKILATAAVREAENGPAFVEEVKKRSGLEISTISGHEEARLSGLGVLAAIPEAEGFMGDLGGGSVELVGLSGGKTGKQDTLPLGPIRMSEELHGTKQELIDIIDPALLSLDWLSELAGKTFYVVGGAWRALAKIYMLHTDYPLHVIHHFEMDAKTASEFCDYVFELTEEELKQIYQDSPKRVETICYAALLMQRVIKHTKPKQLVFSANGVREGSIFDALAKKVRQKDPLWEACKRMPWAQNFDRVDSKKLFKWIDPIFVDTDFIWEGRIRAAACMLSEIGRLEHPDYRVDNALSRVMRFPIVGLNHKERVFLSLAVASRYGTKIGGDRLMSSIDLILSEEEINRAFALGCAMRLGYALTGGVSKKLSEFELKVKDGELHLTYPADKAYMVGELVQKRFKNLAKRLNLTPKIIVSNEST